MNAATLFLASRSPRRAELLHQVGVTFEVVDVEVDESVRAGELPRDYVLRLARAKALAAAASVPHAAAVLAADTTVTVDGAIFGKPADAADARRMLERLSGSWHEVLTAVALVHAGACDARVVSTRVQFRELDPAVIAAYWASGEPADKAGGYGIQGLGGGLVRRIEGSYGAVVGLPLCETLELLETAGIAHALRPVPS